MIQRQNLHYRKIFCIVHSVLFFLLLLMPTSGIADDDFDPEQEFSLISRAIETGQDNPEPLQMFIERCLKHSPDIIEKNNLYLSLANVCFMSKRWYCALEAFKEGKIEIDLADIIHYRTGQCHYHLGDYENAVREYLLALKYVSEKSLKKEFLYALAQAYDYSGESTKQEKIYQKILKEFRSIKEKKKINLLKATSYFRRGDTKRALSELFTIFLYKSSDETTITALETLKKWEKDISIEKIYSSESRLRYAARALYNTGDAAKALTLLQLHLKQYPKSSQKSYVTAMIGHCYYRTEDYEKALTAYTWQSKVVKSASDKAFYLRKKARCYQLLGDYEKALAGYQSVISSYPKGHNARYALLSQAFCLELTGELDEALTCYKKLQAQSSSFLAEEAMFRQAMIYYRMDKREAALSTIKTMNARRKLVSRHEDGLFWEAYLESILPGKEDTTANFSDLQKEYPNSVYFLFVEKTVSLNEKTGEGEEKGPSEQEKLYQQLKAGKIYSSPILRIPGRVDTEEGISDLEKETSAALKAGKLRFHFDFEHALFYYKTAQKKNWKDVSLLLTIVSFAQRVGDYYSALYYAESLKSLFDNIHWDDIPVHIRRFFFPFPHQEEIHHYSQLFSIDRTILASVIHQESRFKSEALSVAGARGLMQIMPGTGLDIAKELKIENFEVDSLMDVSTNIRFGSYYLSNLLRHFKKVTPLALASYNAGRTNVDHWYSLAQKPDHETTCFEILASIRFRETRNYVKKILFNISQYRRLYSSDTVPLCTGGEKKH